MYNSHVRTCMLMIINITLSEDLKWQNFPLLSGEQVHIVTEFLAQKFCSRELRMKVYYSYS